jgi:tetratricopeptide (TPR) repeat protein
VKAGNILVDGSGPPVLTDFGLARLETDGDAITSDNNFMGTPAYLAPEQITHGQSDARTDVYAMGVVMYELLTLRRPFQAVQREALFRAVLESDVPDPRKINSMISRDAWTVMERALSKEPEGRYPSAVELASDLNQLVKGEPVSARPLSAIHRLARRIRRRPLLAVVPALLVALFLSLGYGIARWPELVRGREAIQKSEQKAELSRGWARLTEGRNEDARKHFQTVLDADSTSTLAVAGLALADAENDPARALQELEVRSAQTADPYALLVLRGDLTARLGRTEEVDLSNSKSALAAFIKGSVQLLHVRTGRMLHEAAARAFNEAIFLSSEDYDFFYFCLAEALGGIPGDESAAKIAKALQAKWPNSHHAQYYAGRALRETDPITAAALFTAAAESRDLAGVAHLSAARVHLLKTKRVAEAAMHLEQAALVDEDSFELNTS